MYNGYGKREYRQQDVLGASPARIIVMAYDLAIQACDRQDFDRSYKAVAALRDALDFDQGQVSVRLFSLYQWCLQCIRQGDYGSARQVLAELREAWVEVEHSLRAARPIELPAQAWLAA